MAHFGNYSKEHHSTDSGYQNVKCMDHFLSAVFFHDVYETLQGVYKMILIKVLISCEDVAQFRFRNKVFIFKQLLT